MKRLILLLLSLAVFSACETRTGDELFTQLTVRFVMPDNRPVERLEVLTDISYFENLNTKERIYFPSVEGQSMSVSLQKGVYTLIFEAYLHYTDGNAQYVRNADYNEPAKALTWMNDGHSVALLLKYVN